MTVTIIITSDGYIADVTGAGYNALGEIKLRLSDNTEFARAAISNMLEVMIKFFKSIKSYLFNKIT